ncbi:helix-turn-helix transcriptional regulator [Parasphaerochaeta coccoides]|uniref:Transcriptional regulator, LuxR family n=1 Tax=Parasphaerochaeta coccoides (strain ATCC BAA-1237 / DSM 17374 / SPN1) TaxID=760011 RepID=F4GJE3_PARC1|nr:LuxR family transcriptional regulator [Parasphaerochaeta coccoides]AEC02208.1 transcriptional regulator, LuxR family [Parasphaerochaeta coccoides DSM 17374]
MDGMILLVYMTAFALGCMTLGLGIVYNLRSSYRWTGLFIVLHASLLGCMVMLALQEIVHVVWFTSAAHIITYIFRAVILAATTFLVVFIPYFTTWVIAHPWRNPYKLSFYFLAAIYLALGVLDIIFTFSWISLLWTGIFIFAFFFSLSVLLKNLKNIMSPRVRNVSMSIIIVAFSMIPLLVLGIIFPHLNRIFIPLYFLAYSITLMVFLFMALSPGKEAGKKAGQPQGITLEMLAPYHITEREFSVIKLIANGRTNKEIAMELNISTNTVNNHVANIFSKTEVRSRIDLLNLLKESWQG